MLFWTRITRLAQCPRFAGLDQSFRDESNSWHIALKSYDEGVCVFPGVYDELSMLEKILVLRCIGPHMAIPTLSRWTCSALGLSHLRPAPFDLSHLCAESTCLTPILLMTTSGIDSLAMLLRHAEHESSGLRLVSMGQGQEVRAITVG